MAQITNKIQFYFSLSDRVRDTVHEKILALKKLLLHNNALTRTELREVNGMTKCRHENIVQLKEVVVGKSLTR